MEYENELRLEKLAADYRGITDIEEERFGENDSLIYEQHEDIDTTFQESNIKNINTEEELTKT